MGFKCSVLVVDDEAYIRDMLAAVLATDFDVLTAENGTQARDILAHRDVDIILTDQYLAGDGADRETGIQFLEWIRTQTPGTVRILMTARASLEDAINAINQGQVHRFLIKPLDTQFLLNTLKNSARTLLLERSHEHLLEELRRLNQELEKRVQQRTFQLEEANRQLQYKNSILERMALTDPLTGLPNRRAMDRLVRTELQRRNRHPAPVALGVIDVDFFKNINTHFLLPGGDHVLVWLAQTLSNSLRTIDTVGRIGGEEFMVLAPGTTLEGAGPLAERIRRCVAEAHTDYNGAKIQITVSVGVAVADKDVSPTYEELKQLASTALGEAKDAGRNCCVVKSLRDPGSERHLTA